MQLEQILYDRLKLWRKYKLFTEILCVKLFSWYIAVNHVTMCSLYDN